MFFLGYERDCWFDSSDDDSRTYKRTWLQSGEGEAGQIVYLPKAVSEADNIEAKVPRNVTGHFFVILEVFEKHGLWALLISSTSNSIFSSSNHLHIPFYDKTNPNFEEIDNTHLQCDESCSRCIYLNNARSMNKPSYLNATKIFELPSSDFCRSKRYAGGIKPCSLEHIRRAAAETIADTLIRSSLELLPVASSIQPGTLCWLNGYGSFIKELYPQYDPLTGEPNSISHFSVACIVLDSFRCPVQSRIMHQVCLIPDNRTSQLANQTLTHLKCFPPPPQIPLIAISPSKPHHFLNGGSTGTELTFVNSDSNEVHGSLPNQHLITFTPYLVREDMLFKAPHSYTLGRDRLSTTSLERVRASIKQETMAWEARRAVDEGLQSSGSE